MCELGPQAKSTYPASSHDSYVSRYRGRVIDFHTHFSADLPGEARQALQAGGLEAVVNLVGEWPPLPFDEWHAAWHGRDPVQGMLLFHAPRLEGALDSPQSMRTLYDATSDAFSAGALGLKVWKQLGLWLRDGDGARVPVDDKRLQPVWHIAAEHGRPVGIHIADPEVFFREVSPDDPRYGDVAMHPEWSYAGEEFPSLQDLHDEFEGLVASNPQTIFVGLHFGCFIPLDRLHALMTKYPNLWLETSARVRDIAEGGAWSTRIFGDFNDRIMFGSDLARMSTWVNQPQSDEYPKMLPSFYSRHFAFFETQQTDIPNPFPLQTGAANLTGLGLEDAVLRRIYYDNAKRLLRLE